MVVSLVVLVNGLLSGCEHPKNSEYPTGDGQTDPSIEQASTEEVESAMEALPPRPRHIQHVIVSTAGDRAVVAISGGVCC